MIFHSMIAYAQGTAGGSGTTYAVALLLKIKNAILYPLISLLLGVAIMMFLWGVFSMVMHAENDEARTTGRRHMLWGVIGIVVMLSALTILRIATASLGIQFAEY